MSKDIDNKVVEMRFDNSDFEKNVQTSLDTLDKLKAGLNFDGAAKSFDSISSSANNLDFSGLSGAVDAIGNKFSALGEIALGALTRIGEKIADVAMSFMNTVTQMGGYNMQNIYAGWGKFNEKTQAVAVMESQGYNLEQINEQLEKLNWFSDETSYSFTEMTNTISKFTATGTDLESAATAVQGIANWAALSGQNARTANRAFIQLAQAYGAGVMRLEDYKSIQNVNMDTDEFRQKALDAAVALGTLKENADGTYTSLVAMTDKGAQPFTKSQFAAYLTTGLWFTRDVMTEVFGEYAAAIDDIYAYSSENGTTASEAIEALGDQVDQFGLKAFRAAQEARSWTDVVESVKDAVSTGWMTTFEHVFGSYDQAKILFTDLANEFWTIFAAGGETRNEALAEWADVYNGRELLFANTEEETGAIWNLIYAFEEFVDVVKGAFHEVFDSGDTLGKKLADITQKFKDFTERLRMNEEVADKVKRTFKGIFAALDIVVQLVKSAFSIVSGLFKAFRKDSDEASHGILNVTATIGDWIVKLDQLIKEHQIFTKAADAVSKFLSAIPGYVTSFLQSIRLLHEGETIGEGLQRGWSNLKDSAVEIWSTIQNAVTTSWEHMKNVLEKAKTAWSSFTEFLSSCAEKIRAFATRIKDAFSELFASKEQSSEDDSWIAKTINWITNALAKLKEIALSVWKALSPIVTAIKDKVQQIFKEFNVDQALDIVKTGGLIGALLYIKGFLDKFKNSIGQGEGIAKNIKNIFGGLSDSLQAFQEKIKADVLIKIATAIAILAAAVVVLTLVDVEKMDEALLVIVTNMLILMSMMNKFSDMVTAVEASKISKLGTALIKVSAAVLLLAVAIKMLSKLETEDMLSAVSLLSVLLLVVANVSEKLANSSDKLGNSVNALMKLAVALILLTVPIEILGHTDPAKLAIGLGALAAMIAVLTIAVNKLGNDNKNITKAAGSMILLAVAINMLVIPVEILGHTKLSALATGLGSLAAVLIMLVKAVNKIGEDEGNVAKAAGSMILMAVALNMFVVPIELLGHMKWTELLNGIIGIGAALALLTAAVVAISKNLSDSAGEVLKGAAAMIVMATAVNVIVAAVELLGHMDFGQLITGLVGVGAVLLMLTMSIMAISNSIGKNANDVLTAAAAMVVMAAALTLLVVPVKAFGSMDLKTLAVGFISLAVALGMFIGAAAIVKAANLQGSMMSLAKAILMFGAGVLVAGAGIALFAAGLSTIAVVGTAAALAFIASITLILNAIPGLTEAMTNAGVAIIEFLKSLIAPITELAKELIRNLLNMFAEMVPELLTTLETILEALVEHLPTILEYLKQLISGVLSWLSENSGEFFNKLFDIIIVGLQTLHTRLPEMLELLWAVWQDIFTFLNGKVEIIVNDLITLAVNAINGLANAISANAGDIVGAIDNLILSLIDLLVAALDGSWELLKEAGRRLMDSGVISGIAEKFEEGWNKLTEFVDGLVQKVKDKYKDIKDAAREFVSNFISGLGEKIREIGQAAADLGRSAIDAIKNFLGISSPSKVTEEIGEYFGDGFVNGLNNTEDGVAGSAEELAAQSVEALQNTLTEMQAIIESRYDTFNECGKGIMVSFTDGISSQHEHLVNLLTMTGKDVLTLVENTNKNVEREEVRANAEFVKGIDELAVKLKNFQPTFTEIGRQLASGMAQGIKDRTPDVVNNAIQMAQSAANAAKLALDEHSPSKVFYKIGEFAGSGFVNALISYAGASYDSAYELANKAKDGLKQALESLQTNFSGDTGIYPVVRPVLDLSEVNEGLLGLNGTFDTGIAASLAGAIGGQFNESSIENQNGVRVDNKEVVDSLSDLRKDVSSLSKVVGKLKVVLDTGALVGGITDGIDEELGRQAILAGRGV